MSNNPYTSVAIAGFNSSPPSDDGAQTGSNQLEWQKHVDKLGTPTKDLGEGVNTNVLAAFDALVMTDDPAQETVIGAMSEFAQMLSPKERPGIFPNESPVIMAQEFD